MAKFLTQKEFYRLIQRELPEGVYPDGAPSDFDAAADSDSTGKVLATASANLERIHINHFPQDADEKIADWEVFVLGGITNGLTLPQRQDAVVNRLRERKSLSLWSMLTAVLDLVPFGTTVEIFEFGKTFGPGWQLGISQLGVNTKLGGTFRTIFENPEEYCEVPEFDFWTLGRSKLGTETILAPASGGFRAADWFFERFRAYAFDVRIYDYTLSDAERATIETRLDKIRPARSDYLLRDDLDLAGAGFTEVVLNIDEFNLIDAAFKDAASTETGISGRQ